MVAGRGPAARHFPQLATDDRQSAVETIQSIKAISAGTENRTNAMEHIK